MTLVAAFTIGPPRSAVTSTRTFQSSRCGRGPSGNRPRSGNTLAKTSISGELMLEFHGPWHAPTRYLSRLSELANQRAHPSTPLAMVVEHDQTASTNYRT